MIKIKCPAAFLLTLFFLVNSLGDDTKPALPEGWKTISFKEATANSLLPLQLEFAIPSDFIVKDNGDTSLGSVWGTKKDIEKVFSKKPYPVGESERGFFRIFVSMNTAYFAEKDKFTLEDQKDNIDKIVKNNEFKRLKIGGYPILVQTGEISGKTIFSCYIATLNDTNVLTILFHPPKTPNGKEMELCKTFVSLISRPEYKKIEIAGEDASEVIKNIIDKIPSKTDSVTELQSVSRLGPENAAERPTATQKIIFSEDKTGLKELSLTFAATKKLLEKNGSSENENNFSSMPWIISDLKGNLKIDNGKVNISFLIKDKTEKNPEVSLEEFKKNESPGLLILYGQPFMTSFTFKEFLSELLNAFDFKITGKDSKVITLKGAPKRDAFIKMMKKSSIPEKSNGVDIVEELLKRAYCATAAIDISNHNIISFHIDGTLNEFRFTSDLNYKQNFK